MPGVWTLFCTINPGSLTNAEGMAQYPQYLRMSIIDDHQELDRILASTNLNEYELINSSVEQQQSSGSPHEHTGIGMAPTSYTGSMSGLETHEGSSTELRLEVDPRQGSSLTPPQSV